MPLHVLFVTHNCARELVSLDSFAATIARSLQHRDNASPDCVVLSLQEIAPYAESFLGGSYLDPYFQRITEAVQRAGRNVEQKYDKLIALNVGMTAILFLAKPRIVDTVERIATAGVGVGDYGLGNKGAAALRLFFRSGGTEQPQVITFVAAHLAPFEDAWQRRNQDWANIVRGLCFEPGHSGPEPSSEQTALLAAGSEVDHTVGTGLFYDEKSPVFVAGDLNYRTSDIGPTLEDAKRFPQPRDHLHMSDSGNDYSVEDLKAHDQLNRERKANRTLQGLEEVPFDFPPTYKYLDKAFEVWPKDGTEPEIWSWSKHRFPSFCDRILFSSWLSGADKPLKVHSYQALALQPTSDHRPVALDFELDLNASTLSRTTLDAEQSPRILLSPVWHESRAAARRKELCLGVIAYLTMTWNGNGIALASIIGAASGWLLMRSLLPA